MPDFNLTDKDIHKLQHKFILFQRERSIIHNLLKNYIADYRQFNGSMGKRYEYLRKKYLSQSPNLTHLIFLNGNILWSVQDISIVLGRHITTIIRSINKLERSEGWCARLLSIRETTKNSNGRVVHVYEESIFDLLLDLYEDEYLLRFSQPRRGDNNSAPDILELRRFWQYLKDLHSFNSHFIEQQKHLPDIPPMSWKDILSLIWHKLFSFKVYTVASVFFAVCFEIARRFFGFSLWVSAVPAIIAIISVLLIHKRKFSPDTLSDFAAGALLFSMLWTSSLLSVDKIKPEIIKQEFLPEVTLSSVFYKNNIAFLINSNVKDAKEFFYRTSPDANFHTTALITNQTSNTLQHGIINLPQKGITEIDVKFYDFNNHESKIWHFTFDMGKEFFSLCKQFILNTNFAWVALKRTNFDNKTSVYFFPKLLSWFQGKISIKNIVYGINTASPDTILNFQDYIDRYYQEDPFDPYLIFSIDTDKENFEYISSYLIFKDGSSSDIRFSRVQQ